MSFDVHVPACSSEIPRRLGLLGALLASIGVLALAACAPEYPQVATPLGSAPSGKPLEPPPPSGLLYVAFSSATIPTLTRDGRPWRSKPGSKPDPFGELLVNRKLLFKTAVQSSTLHPTWPHQPKGNYEIPKGATVTVEVWDSGTFSNYPICVRGIPDLRDRIDNGRVSITCDSGAQIVLSVEPAHARFGLGFWYEVRPKSAVIRRVLKYSPAARVQLQQGDQIVRVQNEAVSAMRPGDAKNLIDANAKLGVDLTIRRANGSVDDVTLQDGPVYPLASEGVPSN